MRRSRDQTAESRSRITAQAARLIREGGIVGTGVAEVMEAAGMTHGGFYRHFASKDALVAEAVQQAADETLGRLDDLTGEDLRTAVRSYLSDYLSIGHVSQSGRGCLLAATAEEGARAEDRIRDVYSATTRRMHDTLARALDGRTSDPGGDAWRIVSAVVGAVTLARTLDNRDEIEAILASAARLAQIP